MEWNCHYYKWRLSWVWCCIAVIPARGTKNQKDQEFKVNHGYVAGLRPVWASNKGAGDMVPWFKVLAIQA